MMRIHRNCSLTAYRTYAKWLKRKALRVLTAEESVEFHSAGKKSLVPKPCINTGAVTRLNQDKPDVEFETLRVGDTRFGPVVTAAKSATERERKKIFLLEGLRLVKEAVCTSQSIQCIFFTDFEVLEKLPMKSLAESGVKFYKVKRDHMNLWSDTMAPQGLMAICRQRARKNVVSVEMKDTILPLTLICDNIKDAGILGTLIRSAVAACCRTILITRGCIDAWEPKVLRSGAGTHFHAHSLLTGVAWEQISNYMPEETQVFMINSNDRHSLVDRSQNITKKHGKPVTCDLSQLPSVKYEKIDCSIPDVVLVVGDGLTTDAYQFVASCNGKVISFPDIDGQGVMNAAVSGSVGLFEIVRQLRLQVACTSVNAANETSV